MTSMIRMKKPPASVTKMMAYLRADDMSWQEAQDESNTWIQFGLVLLFLGTGLGQALFHGTAIVIAGGVINILCDIVALSFHSKSVNKLSEENLARAGRSKR